MGWRAQKRETEPQISESVGMGGTKARNSGQSRFGRKKTIEVSNEAL